MTTPNPPSVDIKDFLVTKSVGLAGVNAAVNGWSIFIGNEPSNPDRSITIYDTAGDAPNPKWLLDYPRFQIRVRSNDYLEGFQKAESIKSYLLGLPSQTLGGTRYDGIFIVIDTHFLMRDDKGRSIFVSTWRIIREPSAVTGGSRRPL